MNFRDFAEMCKRFVFVVVALQVAFYFVLLGAAFVYAVGHYLGYWS